ncbi:MAG TPA: hypothetical protein VFS42_05400 [Burkholderiaceae bacterium]|nr:hypothetical protein [Burkholderiaceae bacterium]
MNQLFNPGREGFLDGTIDADTAVIKALLVRGYAVNESHKFLSDVTGSGGTVVATSAALSGKSVTAGVFDANDVIWSAVPAGAACDVVLLVQTSAVTGGADVASNAQRLIAAIDGRVRFTTAAAAASGATSIAVDPLFAAVANGATATKISGTGPSTLTLTASSAANARTISTSAISTALSADAVYEVAISGNGLPVTPNGGDINFTWDNGPNKVFKL